MEMGTAMYITMLEANDTGADIIVTTLVDNINNINDSLNENHIFVRNGKGCPPEPERNASKHLL